MDMQRFVEFRNKIVDNCARVIVGKDEVIEQVLVCFLCSGHVLLEDLPGTGKTMLLRAFAKSIGGDFKRVQFTPDLLPSDLTGINFYNQKTGEFQFKKGPLFSGIILADEINRATPRTQSSLLEAMEEHQVSVDGVTYPMAEPFMVMATQNPIESYGTFPLPEAQTDRFFMRLQLGYMTREQEMQVIARESAPDIIARLEQVVTSDEIADIKGAWQQVQVSQEVRAYMMDIIEKTRTDNRFVTGVSTRGGIALYRAAQVTAALNGRDYVVPEDVKKLAVPVLAHRVSTGSSARTGDSVEYMRKLVESVEVPLERLN